MQSCPCYRRETRDGELSCFARLLACSSHEEGRRAPQGACRAGLRPPRTNRPVGGPISAGAEIWLAAPPNPRRPAGAGAPAGGCAERLPPLRGSPVRRTQQPVRCTGIHSVGRHGKTGVRWPALSRTSALRSRQCASSLTWREFDRCGNSAPATRHANRRGSGINRALRLLFIPHPDNPGWHAGLRHSLSPGRPAGRSICARLRTAPKSINHNRERTKSCQHTPKPYLPT